MKVAVLIFFTVLGQKAFSWGKLGHRITGEVATSYLSGKADLAIKSLVGSESLARMSNYADFIKSDPEMRKKYNQLHYISITPGKSIAQHLKQNPSGKHIISAIQDFSKALRSKKSKKEDKVFALKMLVHLVGDIHQPLHVGKSEDRGGNKITVKWFGKKTNLHAVWDEDLIQMQELSYTEYAKELIQNSNEDVAKIQSDDLLLWAQESNDYMPKVYNYSDKKYWEYNYNYQHKAFLEQRLLRGGIRLAGLLNNIFN